MKKFFAFAVLAFFASGCASELIMDPREGPGLEVVHFQGDKVVYSNQNNLVVARAVSSFSSSNRPRIIVSVANNSNDTFNFSLQDVEVYVDGNRHRILTYEELVDEAQFNHNLQLLAASLGAIGDAAAASNAGYTSHYGTIGSTSISGTTYGSSGYASHYGTIGSTTYSGTSYNYAAAQAAQDAADAKFDAEMESISASLENSISSLSTTILRETTIFPGKSHGGYIVLEKLSDISEPHEVLVRVSAGTETHEFPFVHAEAP